VLHAARYVLTGGETFSLLGQERLTSTRLGYRRMLLGDTTPFGEVDVEIMVLLL
jgi:hypothetical protein